MGRQPKPGEWWFSPDGQERVFCVGVEANSELLWQSPSYVFGVSLDPSFVPVPDCTGWNWELPALPIGWELCNPPKDPVECTLMRVWDDGTWSACYSDYINASEYTYCHCRRVKPADLGPQKEPSSVARIAAQLRQLTKELEELEVIDVD